MPWYIWLLAGDISLSALAKVVTVGRPRRPLTNTDAVAAVISSTVYVYLLVTWGTA